MLKELFKSNAIDVAEANEMVTGGEAVLLDVRTSPEWKQGHAPKAIHISLASLPTQMNRVPTGRPVLVICQSGSRSARAVSILRQAGHDARNVKGGMTRWARAGMPVTKR